MPKATGRAWIEVLPVQLQRLNFSHQCSVLMPVAAPPHPGLHSLEGLGFQLPCRSQRLCTPGPSPQLPALLMFGAGQFFVGWGRSVPWRRLSSIPSLCLLDARSKRLVLTVKNYFRHCPVSQQWMGSGKQKSPVV